MTIPTDLIFSKFNDSDYPKWLPHTTRYITLMGSHAYGCADETSDYDYYGFAVPPLSIVFPNTDGYLYGFDDFPNFGQWQGQSKHNGLDCSIYNIVKYFKLVMDNNPNMLDSIYTPDSCVMFSGAIARLVREQRDVFLSKKTWHTFKGYAFAQLRKTNQDEIISEQRLQAIEKYGFEPKKYYHLVRLLREAEQILTTGTLVLDANADELKQIRQGNLCFDPANASQWLEQEERRLTAVYESSTIPHKPDREKIKDLLLGCLETEFGSLDRFIKVQQQS